ncbi:MAG: hypothetical protein M0C28_48030 [Candidatus Moduliflexus flocculans]|nr:hypothetical protein [Candidatus Moduliflexus flocculans]
MTWTSIDAPLVEIGALTDETPRESERRVWRRKLEPSATLFSYAMNNYWHTNYKADQEGPVTLRYAVSPHLGSDPAVGQEARPGGLDAARRGRRRSGRARAPLPSHHRARLPRRHLPQAHGRWPGLGPAGCITLPIAPRRSGSRARPPTAAGSS